MTTPPFTSGFPHPARLRAIVFGTFYAIGFSAPMRGQPRPYAWANRISF